MKATFKSPEAEKQAIEWLGEFFGYDKPQSKCTVEHQPYGDLITYEDGEQIYLPIGD